MNTATGVYFRRQDYAGFWRRLLIDIIDVAVVIVLCLPVAVALSYFLDTGPIVLICFAIVYAYFVPLKRSNFGTLGYRAAGVKVVGEDGRRPGIFALTLRLFCMVLGPLNYLVDLSWLASDEHRQTIRDKLARTYVIKKTAQPIGTGRLIYRPYFICGGTFLFREIEESKAEGAPAG